MKLFKSIINSRKGTLLLLTWTIIGCVIPNVWLSLTEPYTFIQAITNIILPCGLYMMLMSITPKVGKASLWMIILFIFAAFQIVLLHMYGQSIIAVDMFLNVLTTNPGEVGELLGNLLVAILTLIAIYIPPIILAIKATLGKWTLEKSAMGFLRRCALSTTALGLACLCLSFTSSRPYRPLNDLYPLNIGYNLYLAIDRAVKTSNYHETSADFTFDAHAMRPDSVRQTIVVVVGETSRAPNWQLLGYSRPTTPHLMNHEGLVSFPCAITQSNTTHKSVPMLLSGLDASSFGDSIYHTKSFITAFKEAGFHTYFVSNHNRNHSFIDFFGSEANNCTFIKDEQKNDTTNYYDTDLLTHLDKALTDHHDKKLIILHCYGSHFNYADRYPANFARFTPDGPARATASHRNMQINAYDNTILLTSSILNDIITRLETDDSESALIYTSDHGEDIYDDERQLFLHASPIPSYYQIHVPLLVWLNQNYRATSPKAFNALNVNKSKYVATSRTFFHTILQLGGISTDRLNKSASVLDPTYQPPKPLYLNDHNEPVSLEECGIPQSDIIRLRSIGVF